MYMKLARLVLFFGVLAVGMLAGFSIGYDHGLRDAMSRVSAASAVTHQGFKAKVAAENISSLPSGG